MNTAKKLPATLEDTSKCTECEGPTQISAKGGIAVVMEPNHEDGKPVHLCAKCWRAGL